MALRLATYVLILCSIGYVVGQYGDEGGPPLPKKISIPVRRYKPQSQRIAGPAAQTNVVNQQRFRRPISIRQRPTSEPIPELPVFTSGIRGSHPPRIQPLATSSPSSLEQNDEASAIPIQSIQQPHIVHAQPISQSFHNELKPVNEDHEKDEDVVQVLANLGAVSNGGFSGNLLTPTISSPTPTPHPTLSAFFQQHQPLPTAPQYRPIIRPQQNILQEPQLHQIVTPIQYKPQKPIRLQKHQPQPTRNEYDNNDTQQRPVTKQRAQLVPKKSKPQSDYYEGRPKKPVAQVIRRYREETADGSILWGFENDDGSFKEEMIGIDCITRGKYGYVDPDGLRREYTYETGIRCDEEAQKQQDQDILNTFVDYQENKLVLPSGKTIDLSSMGKKQARRPQPIYRN